MSDEEDPKLTPLQRHVSFFDPDGDGEIRLGQTYSGLRSLGIGAPLSALLSVVINGMLGMLTHGKPSMSVSVKNIVKGKHAFDTGVFDEQGGFDRATLDELFTTAGGFRGAPSGADCLTKAQIDGFIHAHGARGRPYGVLGRWFSGKETKLLLCLAADAKKTVEGKMVPAVSRRTVRRFYEGRLLFVLARRRRIREKLDALAAG